MKLKQYINEGKKLKIEDLFHKIQHMGYNVVNQTGPNYGYKPGYVYEFSGDTDTFFVELTRNSVVLHPTLPKKFQK